MGMNGSSEQAGAPSDFTGSGLHNRLQLAIITWTLSDRRLSGRPPGAERGAVLSSLRHREGHKTMTSESGRQADTGSRRAQVKRHTAETDVVLAIDLDGTGTARVDTEIGFFDHMLTLVARHGLFDLEVRAEGDLETGAHHTVEDVGICLGRALDQALGDKAGITRYGDAHVPMDESLAHVALDLSGRPFLVWQGDLLPSTVIGGFDTELALEFFQALVANARVTAHVRLLAGANSHHMVEAVFKAFARALRVAAGPDPRRSDIPSTKGVL